MVKVDCEKLLYRYKHAVISQNEMHKLESNSHEFDKKIKNVDKEVKDLEVQLLERLHRDETNDGIEILYTFGSYVEV